MGEEARLLDMQKMVSERSPLIKKMIETLETIGNSTVSIGERIIIPSEVGISMPLADVSNGVIYLTLNDANRKAVPIVIEYNTERTNSNKIINQIDMFRRHNFNQREIVREISENPPIVNLVEYLKRYSNDTCKLIKNLKIAEQLIDTKINAPNRTGFFRVDYNPYGKELTGVMIDKVHPYRGVPFSGRVENMHFGRIIKNNLKNYRITTWKGIK